MKIFSNLLRNKVALYILIICGLVFLFWSCIGQHTEVSNDPRGPEYAGSQTCARCHNKISAIYEHTAHFRTSSPVKEMPTEWLSKESYSFNDSISVAIKKGDSGFFQVEYQQGKEVLARQIETGIGSGKDAISFAYWQDNKMYQLPLTYFTATRGWANSPGFPSAAPYFLRPIPMRCMECHGSFVSENKLQDEGLTATRNLDKQSMIYGIDCERCHGPAMNHVNYHSLNPGEKTAKYIARWSSLSRQQKLDVCAVCHSGNDQSMQRPTFGFSPGDTLANYYFAFGGSSAEPDVHGKQYQLLAESRCFQLSQMECTTCHSPHSETNNQQNSSSCISCHKKAEHIDCPVASSLQPPLQQNCVDCHMPQMASKKIAIQSSVNKLNEPYLLRTHRIAVYPEESKKLLSAWLNK